MASAVQRNWVSQSVVPLAPTQAMAIEHEPIAISSAVTSRSLGAHSASSSRRAAAGAPAGRVARGEGSSECVLLIAPR